MERYNRIARYLGFSEADKDWKKYGFEELEQVLFVDLPENAGGEYDDNYCCINLNANGLKTRREASSSFAHEVGHWFELRVLGVDSAIKTDDWLRDVINAPPRRSDKELERLGSTFWTLYDLRRCDVTFWRPDYYAAREYPTHSGNDYNYTPYHPTEATSTAFEGLLTDPEAFARSSPEQFNRVIQALEDFRKARTKNVDKSNKAPRSDEAKKRAPQAPKTDATRPVVEERREPLFKGAATTEKIVPFEPRFSAREAIIFEEMERNRQEATEILTQEGREILPLEKRAQHFTIDARNLGLNLKTLPNGANISGPCTVDRYRDGKWQQRRWYDANGDAEQDYDAAHDGKDVKNSHIFPHLHIWTKNKAGIRCKRSGACATHTRIEKNDRLDD